MASFACAACGATAPLSKHCGRDMHIEAVDGRDTLVCWMGPDCGQQEIPRHCGTPMKATA